MEAIQLRVQGKKLLCGSQMELPSGRAAFTLGSMNEWIAELVKSYVACVFNRVTFKFW